MEAQFDIDQLYEKLVSGDRVSLGKAITLVESNNDVHREQAAVLLDLCLAKPQKSFRFAVSGAPGVGKSTFIEALGEKIVDAGHKLAVLAVDPSSPLTSGAILGDKTRMEMLSRNKDVFIRPSSAGEHLGGVAGSTREAIILCETAGYDRICIETVGVGQSELAAHRMSDFFLLLLLPGGGDDLQGIKKGIVEMADLIAITKTDGEQINTANQTKRFYAQAVHFAPPKRHGQDVKVLACSAIEQSGIEEILEQMERFFSHVTKSGYLHENRSQQNISWLESRTKSLAQQIILANRDIREQYQLLYEQVATGKLSVTSAIRSLETYILKMILKSE